MRYPLFIVYELLRLFFLLRQNAALGPMILPAGWYAAAPLLCVVPALLFMLSVDETAYAHWLPLVTLIKALGVASFAFYLFTSVPNAFSFATSGDLRTLKPLVGVATFAIADVMVGVKCFTRGRALCR